ncbi:post-PEP-CTERM-1 domain-containing protein [Roseateles koreensis]|uniref:Uncharacterized protein n=1 Tax=Roseateles koreensis TaxID=2987526 RepID=A0ABT5KS82_9BURK|nr:hypothetical protein [Roseateles koreensis]MDC8785712.1 hypothetical protein [Roseateles koreensis]
MIFKSTHMALAFAGLAALAATSQPALAHEEHSLEAPTASADQVVVRDVDTGRLRAATAEEHNKLTASTAKTQRLQAQRSGAAMNHLQKQHASGATGARLSDAFMSMSVAVRKPDGTLAQDCFSSKEEAEAALAATKSGTVIGKAAATLETE